LPLLARRQTNVPPLNYTVEVGIRVDYREWVEALPRMIQGQGIGEASVLAQLKERGITHVYIGQRQGRVNYVGPDILKPGELAANPHFRLVYQQDRVWVFEVK
jgi:hypothetical protein